ncbi:MULTISPECIES: hypothetical protein [Cyanophyceae]|uniref:Uncharacterized protein n=1 Tax=Leptolyngbya subtilissima DQ-A4 TaxID=2933933 RepID=A0ABV0KCL3_9CYAN|nr:hypothetical protein [Nodosilinea sp. FACHB-141]MBD2115249.1 hypothetical protein [Nodosilinea sp. FACHB-141]
MSTTIAPETLFALVELGDNEAIAHWLEQFPTSREALLLTVYLVHRSYQYPESDDQLMGVLRWAEIALEPFSNVAQAWACDIVSGYEIAYGRLDPEIWHRARAQSFAKEPVLTTHGA